jgi:hypothetical protein
MRQVDKKRKGSEKKRIENHEIVNTHSKVTKLPNY